VEVRFGPKEREQRQNDGEETRRKGHQLFGGGRKTRKRGRTVIRVQKYYSPKAGGRTKGKRGGTGANHLF